MRAAVALLVGLAGCAGEEPIQVLVDVQTDLVPGVEFQSAQVRLREQTGSVAVTFDDDFRRGRRVAEFDDVEEGSADLSVVLADEAGTIVLRRDLTVDIRGSVGLTVLLTRNCVGVECPAGGPDTIATTCVGGRCVPRECSSVNRTACGTAECSVVRDCAVRTECAFADCLDGICLELGDHAQCGPTEYCQPELGCRLRAGDDIDEDGDGIVADADCDDTDATVGFRAERPCASACATGLERCASGVWGACDAPADCACDGTETRTLSCERCGTVTQTCVAGAWQTGPCEGQGECTPGALDDAGSCGRCGTNRRTCLDTCEWDAPTCVGEGVCLAGEVEDEQASCGSCGELRSRTRTCSPTCNWGTFGAFGECQAGAGCMPGASEMQTQSCGSCGTQTRTRVCGSDCAFGAWSAWGTCGGGGVCAPGTPETESRACGACGTGTETRSRTCTSTCAWGAWSSWTGCAELTTVRVTSGDANSCFIRSDGALFCAGDNDYSQLGDGTTTRSTTPARVGASTGWTSISIDGSYDATTMSSFAHACGVRAGELWCWGRNDDGQLGLGDTMSRGMPTRAGTDTNWAQVSMGRDDFGCATRTTGELFCWGDNGKGQLGIGGTVDQHTPQAVPGTSWASVTTGIDHTCALRTDATLWCWGNGYVGQLGRGSRDNSSIPVQVGGAEWAHVSAGAGHVCAVKTSGELWCWGNNDTGRLGIGTASSFELSPVRVGTASDWSTVGAGLAHTCGIKGTGELWCWGDGDEGQLGNGASTDSPVPVRAGMATDWTAVDTGNESSCGLRAGIAHCWGENNVGSLGIGTTTREPSPVAVCL